MEMCFVSPEQRCVIDMVREDGKSWILGQSLEQVRCRYPDAKEIALDGAVLAIEGSLVAGAVTEIGVEAFASALACVPPRRWINEGASESFISPEHFYGAVTSVYVRIGTRYFTFHDRCTASHSAVIGRVKDWLQQTAGAAVVE
jgi:hypothetical protein